MREFLHNNLHLQGKVRGTFQSLSYYWRKTFANILSWTSGFRWRTQPCAGRCLCTRRWLARRRTPRILKKWWNGCRKCLLCFTTSKWYVSGRWLGVDVVCDTFYWQKSVGDVCVSCDQCGFFSLVQTEHPFKSKKMVWHKLLSKQRRRAVVACFRMTPLYNIIT